MRVPFRCPLGLLTLTVSMLAAPSAVTFSQDKPSVDAYAFVEVEMRVSAPDARNPFTDVAVEAEVGPKGSSRFTVDGFCASADGSVYRVRFMPTRPGSYEYAIRFRQGDFEKRYS